MSATPSRPRPQAGFTLIELMIVVAIIGILASIATTQYDKYVAKAQATEGVALIGNVKMRVAIAVAENSMADGCTMPVDAAASGAFVMNVTVQNNGGVCDIRGEFKVAGVHPDLQGKHVQYSWDPAGDGWQCTSTDLDPELKPVNC